MRAETVDKTTAAMGDRNGDNDDDDDGDRNGDNDDDDKDNKSAAKLLTISD